MNYLLIPGNPPAAHFYELWSKEIQLHKSEIKVRVSHYPDMKHSDDSTASMQEVLFSHFKQVEDFHRQFNEPITLVGHSLGGYFALELLKMSSGMIDKAILLHPFLRSPTSLGLITLNAAGAFHKAEKIQKSFIRIRKGFEIFFGDLVHVSNEEVMRSFHLARHESKTIGKDRTEIIIPSHLKDKVYVYYNRSDTWCTSKVIQQLRKQVSVEECQEPHGFVTSEHHRSSLLRKMISLSN